MLVDELVTGIFLFFVFPGLVPRWVAGLGWGLVSGLAEGWEWESDDPWDEWVTGIFRFFFSVSSEVGRRVGMGVGSGVG